MDVSLIVPAYNEAARIGAVLNVAVASGLFARIFVVDDGSRDGTAASATREGVQVIEHGVNRGKAAAMLTGVNAVSGGIIVFLDADLVNVTTGHLEQLLAPVVSGQVQAALAVFRGGRVATSLAQKISPMISGQRCLRRELLDGFTRWDSGFGIETALNDHLRKLGIEQAIVEWPGAGQVMKEEKRGFWAGLGARLKMYWEILRVWLRARSRRD